VHVGAVTFIQRFDSALRLNVHFRVPPQPVQGVIRTVE
jgi:hypothetical protein